MTRTAETRTVVTRSLAGGAALLVATAGALPGQAPSAGLLAAAPPSPTRPQLEARADVIAGRATAVQGALGLVLPLGTYVRASAVAGGGPVTSGGGTRASARADVIARFLLDPFLERRWGPYGGAGVSARYTGAGAGEGGNWRGYLVALAGVEGPPTHGVLPAIEIGVGGGTRVGVVLRTARAQGR